jgi:hypothetical protein
LLRFLSHLGTRAAAVPKVKTVLLKVAGYYPRSESDRFSGKVASNTARSANFDVLKTKRNFPLWAIAWEDRRGA